MADEASKSAEKSGGAPDAEETGSKDLEGGSYDVIRRRLLEEAQELARRAEDLNQRRIGTFGGSQLALLATERVRTENNCVPRDIKAIGGKLIFGYNVFLGLKSETVVSDVFSVNNFAETTPGAFDLSPEPIPDRHFLADSTFLRDFQDLYRYNRETKLLMLRTTDTRVLAIFQTSQRLSDQRVFRWGVDKSGTIKFIDARGEEDHVLPKQHDFEWTPVRREDQRAGDFPHFSILDEVFVDTVGGDLTIKVENNTKDGRGIYREAVEDANQVLDDADVSYAKVGALILLKIKPYRENDFRYLVFNTRTQHVARVDTIGQACLPLPEEQGIIFPGGYYLRTGDYKVFDTDAKGMVFRRQFKAPNGEDTLFVFDRIEDGTYLLLPYNVIRKEVANPILCHGYSIFDDGKMVVFRSLSDEPTKVHPMQIWQTPFCTQEHAAAAPTDGSYLAKLGNSELVRGISEALTLHRIATTENPTRQTYDDVVGSCKRMTDAFHWLGRDEAANLGEVVGRLLKTSELIIDEFEKVTAIRKRSTEALESAAENQKKVIGGLHLTGMKSVEEYMNALNELRKQRGALISLREMRYMNLPRVDALEAEVVKVTDEVSKLTVEFLLQPTALEPLVSRLAEVVVQVGAAGKAAELKSITEDVDRVGEGLTVLSDIINGLSIDDPTQRTRILEGISEAYAQLNRARATLVGRRKELASQEGRGEFIAQFKLFGQSVVSSLALCDTPEKCDETLSRLLLSLEELEGRFGEFDEFLGDLASKREEVTDAIAAKRQALLDERQRRAQNIASAAERIIAGIARKSRTMNTPDELNTYFASDAMVMKLRDLAKQLFDIGASVKGDELESKLKSARQEALRSLRDKTDLFEGGDNVIRFGTHRFNVNTQPVELALVPRRDDSVGGDVLYVHLTGTDFYERIEDEALEKNRDLWDQQLVSESPDVYRSEFLAASMLHAAELQREDLTLQKLTSAAMGERTVDGVAAPLLELVRVYSQTRHDEGYERGVHDVDAALILAALIDLRQAGGLLQYPSDARALACLLWAETSEAERALLHRRARSFGFLRARLDDVLPQRSLAKELEPRVAEVAAAHRVELSVATLEAAAAYVVEELATEHPRFITSESAIALRDALMAELESGGGRRDFEDDLRALEKHPAERLGLVRNWITALAGRHAELAAHKHAILEAAVLAATERRIDRANTSASVAATVTGLLGQHPVVKERSLHVRLDEWLLRIGKFVSERAPRFRAFRKTKQEILDRERKRLRLDEFAPKILSSFVRNQLIDKVYLPLVGANLAKQMGSAGENKRTDQMGLLLLISPPGYGKTTLMEYVASKLGLIFMKVNGPALGHEVTSIDPNDAPNATARQEVDKVNLALEMGNNVMLYIDDIQHTNPEFLQKFISLCDAQRRIEGVWKGKTRTYDMRGKKFCVVMAGNPYTESGEKFKIPDMLANRADTYNLGDILDGKADLFALSYLENALTSNKALQPLSSREPADTHKLIRMAKGESIAMTELAYPYSAAEVNEIVEVLKRLFMVQDTLLKVNLEYIASASQDDNFRTEPPFKLQGSYRNMNKVTEKIVSAHTEAEVQAVIDDHYAGEAQTLTTGAENNLLKLADLRGRLDPERAARWEEIKRGFVRVKLTGGKQDDPVARVTGSIAGVAEQLDGVQKSLATMVQRSAEPAKLIATELGAVQKSLATLAANAGEPAGIIATQLSSLHDAVRALGEKELTVEVERDPAIAELIAEQLRSVETTLAPLVAALAQSLVAAGQTAQSMGRGEGEALRSALAEASKKVEEVAALAAAQQGQVASAAQVAHQLTAMQRQLIEEQKQAALAAHQVTAQAKDALVAQKELVNHQSQMAAAQREITAAQRQMTEEQRSLAQHQQVMTAEQRELASHQKQIAAHQQQITAHQQSLVSHQQQIATQQRAVTSQQEQLARDQAAKAQATPPSQAPRPGTIPPGPAGLVQRPGASPEENEAIARAQQAMLQSRQGITEVQGAVQRVEGRLGELVQLVRQLQDRTVQAASAQGPSGMQRFDASIDFQSASNFYKWRPNANVVTEGGVFVATRRRPPNLGQEVILRVTLPGGAELEAKGVVEWSRPMDHDPQTIPGFGARFVDLPSYARQLVDHFIQRRAPIVFQA
jgi:hypothetical protein